MYESFTKDQIAEETKQGLYPGVSGPVADGFINGRVGTYQESFEHFRDEVIPQFVKQLREQVSCERNYPSDAWGTNPHPLKTSAPGSGYFGKYTPEPIQVWQQDEYRPSPVR